MTGAWMTGAWMRGAWMRGAAWGAASGGRTRLRLARCGAAACGGRGAGLRAVISLVTGTARAGAATVKIAGSTGAARSGEGGAARADAVPDEPDDDEGEKATMYVPALPVNAIRPPTTAVAAARSS